MAEKYLLDNVENLTILRPPMVYGILFPQNKEYVNTSDIYDFSMSDTFDFKENKVNFEESIMNS